MNRKSYRVLALVFVFALLLGGFAAMAPAAAQASDMGGPKHHAMYPNKASFSPDQLPDPFVRDFDGRCEWWKYELRHGKYVRTYCPCKYGDEEVSYRLSARSMWANFNGANATNGTD